MNLKTQAKSRPYDKNPELIEQYRGGSEEAGEKIVTLNKPLVFSIAQRFVGRGVDTEDLVAIGNIGLVKAINTFDAARGCAFSTYAVPLIFGEIRRFLRDDGIIKVSREEKRLCAALTAEKERRMNLGEDVSLKAIAAAVGVAAEDAASALFSGIPPRSLDECAYQDEDSVCLGNTLFDEDEEERQFNKLSISMAIEELSPFHRKLIVLRYFRDLSQSETANILGVTQVKISREEKKILKFLKEKLS